jgi:hypothetical protein
MLQDGDRVRVVSVTAADVRVGDVAVLAGATGPIIHRLVAWWPARGGRRMVTKGDGSLRLDPPARPDDLIGRVVARVRNDQVRRLDGIGVGLHGRGRALLSLGAGLAVEVWDRARRRHVPRNA